MISSILNQDSLYNDNVIRNSDFLTKNSNLKTELNIIPKNNSDQVNITAQKIENFKEILDILHKAGFVPIIGEARIVSAMHASEAYLQAFAY